MAVSRYMMNMASMETLATFCMRFLVGLVQMNDRIYTHRQNQRHSLATNLE